MGSFTNRATSVVVAFFCGAIGCADDGFGADLGQGMLARSASVQNADGIRLHELRLDPVDERKLRYQRAELRR